MRIVIGLDRCSGDEDDLWWRRRRKLGVRGRIEWRWPRGLDR